MREQGSALSADERRQVAEFLTGRPIDAEPREIAASGLCSKPHQPLRLEAPGWIGWSPRLDNTAARFPRDDWLNLGYHVVEPYGGSPDRRGWRPRGMWRRDVEAGCETPVQVIVSALIVSACVLAGWGVRVAW